MSKLTAQLIYSGLVDFWSGDGRRNESDKACLFAHYDTNTSLREIVDEWVADFNYGGNDSESMHADIDEYNVRAAILSMLTDAGFADYNSGALSEYSISYAKDTGLTPGVDLSDQLSSEDLMEYEESPVIIILLESDVCSGCEAWEEHWRDNLCAACASLD